MTVQTTPPASAAAGRHRPTGLTAAGMATTIVGTLVVAILHLTPPTSAISPLHRTISEYGLTAAAWAFNLGVLLIVAGSVLIFAAAGRAGRLTVGAGIFGALWVSGLVILVVFPKADWAIGPSMSGYVHRAASMVAFLALPLAIMLLTRRRGPIPSRPLFLAGPLSYLWLVPLPIVIAIHPDHWWLQIPLGLLERGLALTEVIALVGVAVVLRRQASGGPNIVLP